MIDILRSRRSCRKFKDSAVEDSKVEILKEALLRSPSSKNNNAWEFIFVDQPDLLEKLSQCKPHGGAFLKNAPLAVVITADSAKGEVWVEDCSIASIILQLTAQSLDLGSCWIQVRGREFDDNMLAEEYIRPLLNMPPNLKVLSIIAIGYPENQRAGKPFAELQQEKIHINGIQ